MKFVLTALFSLSLAGSAFADKTAGEAVDDTWIHTKVKTALVGHGTSDINIEVWHGAVQLAGFINSETQKRAAVDAAAAVEGVLSVSDQLVVVEPGRSAGRTLDDNVLTGRVKSAVADGDFGRGLDVNVEVNRGRVLLSGFVDSSEVRDKVVEIATETKGVAEVINGMDLKD